MQKLFNFKLAPLSIEIFFLSLCFAVFFLLKIDVDFSLIDFNKLIISQASADAVNVNLRVSYFYKFVFLSTILLVSALFIFNWLDLKFKLFLEKKSDLIFFAVAYLGFAFLDVVGFSSKNLLNILEIIILLRVISLLLRKNKIGFGLQLSLAILFTFLCVFLFGNKDLVSTHLPFIFFIFLFLIIFSDILLYKFFDLSKTKIRKILSPIYSIPWLTFLAVELNFYIQQLTGNFFGYKLLFLILLGFYLGIYFLFIWLKKSNKIVVKFNTWVSISILFLITLLINYQPFSVFSEEMFEMANPVNSVMNVFKFGEIPMVDFLSSHLLSEQWFGYLYTLIFGFDGSLDFLTYGFFNEFIFILIAFLFFNKIFKNSYHSLLFCCLFPFLYDFLFPAVFFGIIPFLLIENLIKQKNYQSILMIFLSLIVLIVWRIDTGAIAVYSMLIFSPILFFCLKLTLSVKELSKAIIISFLFIICTLIILFIFRNPTYVLNNLKLALHYFGSNQAHGYSSILVNSHQFYLYHVLFPAISVFTCVWIIFKLRSKEKTNLFQKEFLLFSSLFLFILFLANAQRGLVRHGFAEQNETFFISTFYVAVALFLLRVLSKFKSNNQAAFFFGISFLLFISLKYFNFSPNHADLEYGISKSSFFNLNTGFNKQFTNRVKINETFYKDKVSEFKLFLDANLSQNQTFMDFSNTPTLYFFTKRKIAGYFNQNLQNTIDDFMQIELIKELNTKTVPVVVFSNDPPNWFDYTDGIQNTVRYYLLSEYIQQNYLPYKTISEKSIWVSKTLFQKINKTNYLFNPYEKLYLKNLPFFTAKFIQNNLKENPIKLLMRYDVVQQLTSTEIYLNIPTELKMQNHMYICFDFFKSNDTIKNFQFELNSLQDSTKLSFIFDRKNDVTQNYFVRLSNHSIWHRDCDLRLKLPQLTGLKSLKFYKDLRFEN